MIITDEVIESFITCKYKGYLKLNSERGNKTEFEILDYEILQSRKQEFYKNLRQKINESQILNNFDFERKTQIEVTTFVISPSFQSTEYDIKFDIFEILPKKNSRKNSYIPLLISPREKVSKIEKLILCLKFLIVSKMFKITTNFGKILYGHNLKITKFSLNPYLKESKKLLKEIIEIADNKQTPKLYQNSHCNICEFQEICRKELIKKDDMSLLGSMTQKQIVKQNNKGIFTIKQLSYTFRPRRKRKKIGKSQRFLWELKALALREKQTYILETPKLAEAKVEIFLDIEGLPEENFNYLIGLIIRKEENEIHLFFWANSKQDEQKIFKELFTALSKFSDFIIYHYGNYEIRALKNINKQLDNEYEDEINKIIERSVNVLALFHNNVYPPTYGNGLKEIAGFLGYEWSDTQASGIQSIVWRKKWELSEDPNYREKLVQYNKEDCLGLKLIKDWLSNIRNQIQNDNQVGFIKVENLKAQNLYFGSNYQNKDFNVINKFAYFDYQHTKIYLRTDKNIKKRVNNKIKSLKSANKINKTVIIPSLKNCPHCFSNELSRHQIRRKTVIDLKFFNYGVKKWILQYETRVIGCHHCEKYFTPDQYKKLCKYGRNLKIWIINQSIVHRTTNKKIIEMLFELFNISVPKNITSYFKSLFSQVYKDTFEEIKESIINGYLIQVDETSVSIKGISKYVWVFTNFNTVFYIFQPTRETHFLKDLLKEFKGVLISDFYTGYDSINCTQQKCLVHLMRNLNEDLFKNQFDIEYKKITTAFGQLLRKIVVTIDKYGLKTRHLHKHKKDVAIFYKTVIDIEYKSELANKYQKRFKKNQDKLFVFLDHDNIPWNNNNAEHAIKPFAAYRRNTDGLFTEKSINDYLILFSIQQTCQYREISFFEFLKSGEKSIEEYSSKF